ncbi:unnamed protein product [Spirodela intermedia]|uniref:Uncharacterized protein n=1 Tax=Spirodela intermedia TaxID=51605 RepID=A0A7I8KR22_SPIIN|nr:unnamed protein product [Spirodela intermedia]
MWDKLSSLVVKYYVKNKLILFYIIRDLKKELIVIWNLFFHDLS